MNSGSRSRNPDTNVRSANVELAVGLTLTSAAAISILAVRPLLSEVFEPVSLGFLGTFEISNQITPLLTLGLDAALLVLAAFHLSPRRLDATWLLTTGALTGLVVAVALSSLAASNGTLALRAGFSMIAPAIIAAAILSARQSSVFRRTVLSAGLATAVVFALKCWLQVYVEFPETRADWEQRKAQLGVEGYRPELINFERRLLAAEPSGYQSHSNVAASLLMLGLLPLIAIALAARVRATDSVPALASALTEKDNRLPAILIPAFALLLLGGALAKTGSAGAYVSSLVGLATLLMLQTPRVARQPAWKLLTGLWATYAMFLVALLGWGVLRGSFPHASLTFRWEYWAAGWNAWLEQPWTGLGRENFLAGYLQFKQAWATEEVRNPHSIWATLLFELGPLGLVSGATLLILALWHCIRHARDDRDERPESVSDDRPRSIAEARIAGDRWLPYVVPPGVIGLHAFVGENHFEVPGWGVIWLTEIAFAWLAAYALFQFALHVAMSSERGQAVVSAGLAAAVVAAVFHNTIDFSLTVPAGQAMLALLITAAGSGGTRLAAVRAAPRAAMGFFAALIVVMALGILYAYKVLVPGLVAERLRASALRAPSSSADFVSVHEKIRRVASRTALDPSIPRSAVRVWLRRARDASSPAFAIAHTQMAREWIALAIQRDPRSLTNVRLAADVEVVAARCATSDSDRVAALEAALRYRRRATELYPTDPRGQIQLAVAAADYCGVAKQVSASQPAESAASTREAATEGLAALKRAREIDATRKPIDVVRLQPEELRQMEELRSALVRFAELKR